jgi:hypothetical protein
MITGASRVGIRRECLLSRDISIIPGYDLLRELAVVPGDTAVQSIDNVFGLWQTVAFSGIPEHYGFHAGFGEILRLNDRVVAAGFTVAAH